MGLGKFGGWNVYFFSRYSKGNVGIIDRLIFFFV